MARLTTPPSGEPDIGSRSLEGEEERLHSGPRSDDAVDPESAGGALADSTDDSTTPLLVESEAHVDELTDKRTRDRIFNLLCLSALVDTMGASLLSPAYAMAVSRAPGSVPPVGGIHRDAFPSVPISFSLAINAITSALVLGGVFSSLTMGPASDKLGRKPLILVGLLGGVSVARTRSPHRAGRQALGLSPAPPLTPSP